jgi:hypothetical protein
VLLHFEIQDDRSRVVSLCHRLVPRGEQSGLRQRAHCRYARFRPSSMTHLFRYDGRRVSKLTGRTRDLVIHRTSFSRRMLRHFQ